MFIEYLQHLIYGYYPYLAGTVFLVGSLMRYDQGQFTWKTGSSQMLSSKNMRLASNLFHIGIIVIFFGHLVGMLTPHWVYAPFLHAGTKQLIAIVVGGIAGAMCVVGGAMLLYRRVVNPRVKASSSMMDTLILGLIVLQACLGMVTIIFSLGHMDGEMMLTLSSWAPDGVEHLRKALTAPAAQEEETTLEISSDGAPDYRIRVRAPDFKQAER